jgi:hypothetical protein
MSSPFASRLIHNMVDRLSLGQLELQDQLDYQAELATNGSCETSPQLEHLAGNDWL